MPVLELDASQAGPRAIEMCAKHLGVTHTEGIAALAMLREQAMNVIAELAEHQFPRFTRSEACKALCKTLHGPGTRSMVPRPDLVWSGYDIPADCAGWLHSIVGIVEDHPCCFVISDMSMPGNPMIYVNRTFCRITGYEKYEASGRNCRFLQGPGTEPESVLVIQDTLRRGADCHVRLTNYRKDGSMFINLLTMRPIHDSNDVYRYCVGVQCELNPNVPIKEQVKVLDSFIKLIPVRIEVSSRRVGNTHLRTELHAEKVTDLDTILERAMSGDGSLSAHSQEAREEAGNTLRNNRARVLQDICNPSRELNIDGKPLTQPELVRVAPEKEADVDEALREIESRLLGKGFSSPASEEAATVWAAVGKYLNGRLQGSPEEKQGRKPDMSAEAAAAMRAVLNQLEWIVCKDLYADNHQEMLEHLSSQALTRRPGGAASVSSAASTKADEKIEKLAAKTGVPAPSPGQWLQMLCEVVENIPLAMLVTDMCVPGLPITYCNQAMSKLTGYERGEIRGRNCRMLQGPMTEAAAVRQMIVAVRTASPTTVRVTNYRKDGSTFRNMVTIAPVFDTNGVYRFSIGVLSDVERAISDGNALQALRAALPDTFDAAAQPPTFDPDSRKNVAANDQRKQLKDAVLAFTPIRWINHPEQTVMQLLCYDSPVRMTLISGFLAWAYTESPEDMAHLELLTDMMALADLGLSPYEAGQRSIALCKKYFGMNPTEGAAALATLEAQPTISIIATNSFAKFVRSTACAQVIGKLRGRRPSTPAPIMQCRRDLLWANYDVPPDCAEWLHGMCSAAETHAIGFVVSDMSIPGNPLVFVNSSFCGMTGYEKHETMGQNCRFLQGPETEPEAVAWMTDCLRRGADCYVRITNYRKSGEPFYNLLVIRPVHDSNDVYRFCIGLQQEIDPEEMPSFTRMLDTIALLPRRIQLPSTTAVGKRHYATVSKLEETADPEAMLMRALAGDGPLSPYGPEHRSEAGLKLHHNRKRVLKDLCNPTRLAIDGIKPLSQPDLVRLPPEHEEMVDAALLELEHRLLGEGTSAPQTQQMSQIWAGVSMYLDARIQSTPGEKAGRRPDMSPGAAAAMRAVLLQMRAASDHERYAANHYQMLAEVVGSAALAKLTTDARHEAGMLLRNNHVRVLKDLCNPSVDFNIDGKPLTQLELTRVAPKDEAYADEALCEIERRLLGEGSTTPLTTAQCTVWSTVAIYLDGRVQGTPEQKPGRKPDMSAEAAEALRTVLAQIRAFSEPDEEGRAVALRSLGHVVFTQADRLKSSSRERELKQRVIATEERARRAAELLRTCFHQASPISSIVSPLA